MLKLEQFELTLECKRQGKPEVLLNCEFVSGLKIKFVFLQQNTIQDLNGQSKLNFRQKEGFVLLYDMTSERQIKDLPEWIDKIIENTTINNSVILIMGNKLDETTDYHLEQIETQRLEI